MSSATPQRDREPSPPLRIESIVGWAADSDLAAMLHEIEHRGGVEHLVLDSTDSLRHRLRAVTDRGTECALAIPRWQKLSDGAVLWLEKDRAVVVRMRDAQWVALRPRDAAAALEVGYFAGNMHWKVEFAGEVLRVAVEGPIESYLERLAPFIADRRAVRVSDG